ncbi:DNA polymerase III subunit beta [Candidatus Gracilibacteria bacterium]|nr:MAG: DNA polymerase III subunit beta [Candidatus Gracilibacteria bacterium]PIE85626.1 MAG: DNA polymerase III subunit beta [Candidatus Gracilibacteria bacterium]
MKFKINSDNLKKGLAIVNHATATITTTPILENILLKVNYNNLVLTSNNLEMAIEYVINENIEISSEGSFCVPSKLFTNYVSLINDDTLEIELLDDDSIKIKTESGKVKIKGLKSEEFPLIPKIKEEISMTLSSKVLKKSIEKTLFSSAEGNIRPTLAGILVNIDSKQISFATTDSFRLSEYKIIGTNKIKEKFSEIIPSKTASELKSILEEEEEVKIISGENQIAFLFGQTKFYSRLLNGKFPNYEAFFPNSYGTKAEINRVDLMGALKKINLISRENNYSIKISFSSESGILLESSETQVGEGDVKLVGAVEGANNIIGINSVYLLEVLGVIDTTHISISFETPLSQILITPIKDPEKKDDKSSFKHIIMPLKI